MQIQTAKCKLCGTVVAADFLSDHMRFTHPQESGAEKYKNIKAISKNKKQQAQKKLKNKLFSEEKMVLFVFYVANLFKKVF